MIPSSQVFRMPTIGGCKVPRRRGFQNPALPPIEVPPPPLPPFFLEAVPFPPKALRKVNLFQKRLKRTYQPFPFQVLCVPSDGRRTQIMGI